MPDYASLIDAETWAFIRRTESFYPPDAVNHTVSEQRAVYDGMCRAFHAGHPEGVSVETTAIPAEGRAIPVRIYRAAQENPAAVVLYLHGGGFVVGGLDSHDDVCAEISARTGFRVASIDYRLAPEHTHPAAFDDALDAFLWTAREWERPVVLVGDSAGGNLAAAVSHAARSAEVQPIGQVLIYPGLGGPMDHGSYLAHAHAPMLTSVDLDFYRDIRAGGRDVTQDPSFAPLADADFSGLPPTAIVTAQCDPLSSDGETYRDRILAAGGRAWWREEPGLVHGFLRARHSVRRARECFARIVDAVGALGRGEQPF
ncbi:MAG TPA: alpha/beta hydrolase [Mesorhizobium sp.]|jgi:acetyl esterase|nr:alpha/beta hydrolase [Mesorhizobium sp.]